MRNNLFFFLFTIYKKHEYELQTQYCPKRKSLPVNVGVLMGHAWEYGFCPSRGICGFINDKKKLFKLETVKLIRFDI